MVTFPNQPDNASWNRVNFNRIVYQQQNRLPKANSPDLNFY